MRGLLLFFFVIQVNGQLGWMDVCNSTERACYMWPLNNAPYNNIMTFVVGNSLFKPGFTLYIQPFNRSCSSWATCSDRTRIIPQPPLFAYLNFATGIPLQTANITIRSMYADLPVIIGITDPSVSAMLAVSACGSFKVFATDVSFIDLTFILSPDCATGNSYVSDLTPIIYQGGGKILLKNIITTNARAAVLFHPPLGQALLNMTLTLQQVTSTTSFWQPPYYSANAILLQVSGTVSVVNTKVFLLGTSTVDDPSLVFNASSYTIVNPTVLNCPVSTISYAKYNTAHSTYLGILITNIVLLVIQVVFILWKFYEKKVGAAGRGFAAHAAKQS